jgi:hypothetical protein
MMKRFTYLFLVVLITACSSIDCPVDAIVQTKYQIRNGDGTEHKLIDTLTIISTRSDGKDVSLIDSTLYNKGVGISEFAIPISYQHPEDVLMFHFNNSKSKVHVVDTVWVKKDDIPHFESVDCKASFFHEITDVRHTRHYIDSLVLLNHSVTYDRNTVHFRLVPKSGN